MKGERMVLGFGDARVLVQTDSQRLFLPLLEYLREHLVDSDLWDAEIILELKKVLSPIPTHSQLCLRYFTTKIFYLKGTLYFTDFRSYLWIEPGGKKAQGFISPETLEESGIHFFTHTFFSLALFELLRHLGIFFLHSAGVVSPEGVPYLFPASGGQGKSTISIYLIHQGFKYLSDDTVFLRRNSQEVILSGFKKLSHLPEKTMNQFPELNLLKNAPSIIGKGKKAVDLAQVYPGQKQEQVSGNYVIVFPQRVSQQASQLKPLTKLEGFHLLVSQSPFAFINPALAQKHLNIIRDLLSQSRIWLLESGEDWIENPQLLVSLLSQTTRERKEIDGTG